MTAFIQATPGISSPSVSEWIKLGQSRQLNDSMCATSSPSETVPSPSEAVLPPSETVPPPSESILPLKDMNLFINSTAFSDAPRDGLTDSSNVSHHHCAIIPAVNGEQPILSDEQNEFQDHIDLGLDGVGLGTDDFGNPGSGANQGDADFDPAWNGLSSVPGSQPGKRKPLPAWFRELVAEKIQFLKRTDTNRYPLLYRTHGTFWLPQKAAWFNMIQSPHVDPTKVYNPRFFYWDPIHLVAIKCPICRSKNLTRHGGIFEWPRRCVDLEGCFWLIGARYCCTKCPKNKGTSITFMSWDSWVMTSLPNALAAEFPATLTHRSGLASSVFALQRGPFVNGFGAKQFSDLLHTLHLRKFDLMQIQYLDIIDVMRLTCPWSNTIYEPFSSYEDPEGYAGFVPCSQWLRDLFDCFIEKHNIDIKQFTAMLSARICAIDHSHKITKHNNDQWCSCLHWSFDCYK